MAERWEYMAIEWESTRDVSHDYSTFYVYKPGEKTETLPGHDSRNPQAEGNWYLDLLRKFGMEGWELSEETVLAAASVQALGWRTVQSPVHMRWTLKRRTS
jgi:hypothetical protein